MRKVLLIDDDQDYASLIRMRLEEKGYHIEYQSNPVDAIKHLEKNFDFDVIILDVQMPERNGLSTLAHLRGHFKMKNPKGKGFDIPIIVATGLQSEKLRDIFESQAVADYLQKPFDSNVLIEKIEKVVADYHQPKKGTS
ncbi:MAG: response regulator [Candidatus Omnitrophica bacterium]|nr:response regulator [Candidatus Omnitrophota bacterium]